LKLVTKSFIIHFVLQKFKFYPEFETKSLLQKLLEKTRQRREQLQQKLQSTPSSVTRKRKPLQIDTSQNAVTETAPGNSSN